MAKYLDITPGRLRQLAGEGIVPKIGRDRYPVFQVSIAYIRFLRDRVSSPEISDSEFHAARLAKLKSEREQIELNMAIQRRERLPIADCLAVDNEIFQAIAGTLKANAGKLLNQTLINEIFQILRDWATRFVPGYSGNGQTPPDTDVANIVRSFVD
jgi:hypothetical protein